MVLTHYQIVRVVLYASLNLIAPPLPYSELAAALVKPQFSVNRLVVSVRG